MKKVYICSPYRGDIENNVKFARVCCRFAYEEGVVPFAPHLFFPQFLSEETERMKGIRLGLEMMAACDEIWAFVRGEVTDGMKEELKMAGCMGLDARFFSADDIQHEHLFGRMPEHAAVMDYTCGSICCACENHKHLCLAQDIDGLSIEDGVVTGCSAFSGYVFGGED